MKKDSFDRGTKFGLVFDRYQGEIKIEKIALEDRVPTKDIFETKYASHSIPFLFKNSFRNDSDTVWQKILKEHPDKLVKVRHGDYANPKNYAPEKRALIDQKLSDYIQEILINKLDSKTPPYAGNFTLPIDFLASIGANFPNYYPHEVFEAPTVWLGIKNCITPLHRDSSDNFAIHITGKKRWTIFSPADAPHLYMSSVSASKGGDFATSAIDLRNPNLDLFPHFKNAQPITFDVESGETLYLPMGWSHFVENLEPSMMVNYWLSVEPIGAAFLRR